MAPSDAPKTRLVVLFGGQSAEHEVSLVTARHVLAATDPDRYRIEPIAIQKDGRWTHADDVLRALQAGPEALPDSLPTTGTDTSPLPAVAAEAGERVVVMPLLHGPLGEDGTVQGLLELADVPYVGCGVLASALAMDKAKSKELFAANGLPQAEWSSFHETEIAQPGFVAALADEIGFPLFVKPANMGSSVGVTKARDLDELRAALAIAAQHDEWIVVEEAITGRELECAVLGNLEPRASLPGEIEPGAEFYDYEDKYHDGRAKLLIPAPLDPSVVDELQRMACDAFSTLRCEGMARVDFFFEEGGRGLLLNEVNTIPGFTPVSMYPQMWNASGLAYPELIDELIRLAVERYDRRATKRRRA
jgi:D-alanine-D-alanine ligase